MEIWKNEECSNGIMDEWKSKRTEEWRNGRMEERKNGGTEEWKNGRMEEWKNDGMKLTLLSWVPLAASCSACSSVENVLILRDRGGVLDSRWSREPARG